MLACAKPPMKILRHLSSLYLLSILVAVASCNQPEPASDTSDNTANLIDTTNNAGIIVDIQGHRGARGVYPENSLEGFLYALEQGVTTLELDVVISKDGQVVVSHEPWMSKEICLHVSDDLPNIYQLNYAEIRSFDCGSKYHAGFPTQKKITTYKPKLTEVFQTVEELRYQKGLPAVWYNIETKSTPEGDNVYHPAPNEFAQIVYNVIVARGMKDKVTIQSFDVRTLQAMKNIDATLPLVLLVSEEKDAGIEANLSTLGFVPQVYSPQYTLVNADLVAAAHGKGMKVVPWTVNDSTEIAKLLTLGVDGIITDYPALGVSVGKQHHKKQL